MQTTTVKARATLDNEQVVNIEAQVYWDRRVTRAMIREQLIARCEAENTTRLFGKVIKQPKVIDFQWVS